MRRKSLIEIDHYRQPSDSDEELLVWARKIRSFINSGNPDDLPDGMSFQSGKARSPERRPGDERHARSPSKEILNVLSILNGIEKAENDFMKVVQEFSRGAALLKTLWLDDNNELIDLNTDALSHLTGKETTIIHCIKTGMSNESIATQLGIKLSTVKSHLQSIFLKMNVHNRTQLALTVEHAMRNQEKLIRSKDDNTKDG